VYGTIMVGIPAPAIVGRSVGPESTVPEESVAMKEPLELEREPVLVAEEESVVEASVDVAVLDFVVDFAVEEAVVLVDSSAVPPLRSGRPVSCAFTIGAPARASSASSCVFLARRTMFAVVVAAFLSDVWRW
jgi:hypothetical protein